MSDVLYGPPSAPPGPGGTPWPGVEIRWAGWDGSVWDLGRREAGAYLRAGVRGFTMPQFTRFTSQSASVPGSRHRGSRALERDVFWPLSIYHQDGSQAWLDFDRAFWRTMHPARPGVWSVRQPSGQARHLTCRFAEETEPDWVFAPGMDGWVRYGVYLVAEDPFWRGDPILRSWKAAEPVSFFGESGGPPFHISSSSTAGTARITNPGDEPAWPLWVARDYTTVTAGVGDQVVEIGFSVDPGRMLVVDTRPTVRTARDYPAPPGPLDAAALLGWIDEHRAVSVNRTRELGAGTGFAAVPPGQAVDLSLEMIGGGLVEMILVPQYHRAW